MTKKWHDTFVNADDRNLFKIDFFKVHELFKNSDCLNVEKIDIQPLSV